MSKSEEDFLVDTIARGIGWGCVWLLALGLLVCTVSSLAVVCMVIDLASQ